MTHPRWFPFALGVAVGFTVGAANFLPTMPTPKKQTLKLFHDGRKPALAMETTATAKAPGTHRARGVDRRAANS